MSLQLKPDQLKILGSDPFVAKEITNCHFDFLQTRSRMRQLNNNLQPTLLEAISSSLYLLVSTSATNTSLRGNDFSGHFSTFLQLGINNIPEYSEEFIQDSIYTERNTWATELGTVGYYLNLEYNDPKYHYLTPGELGYYAVLAFLTRMGQTRNVTLDQFSQRYLALAKEDTEANAGNFYNITWEIWQALEFTKTLNTLDFLSEFLPRLSRWYFALDQTRELTEIEEELKVMALSSLQKNLDFSRGQFNFSYQFAFGALPPIYLTLFREILERRTLTLDNIKISSLNLDIEAEALYGFYLDNVSLNLDPNLVKLTYEKLLNQLAPPGGLNLLLLISATFLMANAYNLARRDESNPEINRLIALAGRSLSKSNLNHLKLIAKNLLVLSNLVIDINPQELTDIRK